MIKPKNLQDFLDDDKSLTEKITYEEFQKRNIQENSDDNVDDVYKAYRNAINTLNAKKGL